PVPTRKSVLIESVELAARRGRVQWNVRTPRFPAPLPSWLCASPQSKLQTEKVHGGESLSWNMRGMRSRKPTLDALPTNRSHVFWATMNCMILFGIVFMPRDRIDGASHRVVCEKRTWHRAAE